METKELQINEAYLDALENQSRYLIFKGGAGSGKSVFCAQKILLRVTTEPGHRFLVVRKVGKTLRRSVFKLFKDLVKSYGLSWRFKFKESDMEIIDLMNDNTIYFAGMDDQEKLKSIQGITGIWVEEMTESEEEDFDQLDLRLRGETANYKQIMGSFNPVSIHHWIKGEFFEAESDQVTTVETTFEDNAFLDDEYKEMLLKRFRSKENWFRIYVKNQWGVPTTGEEFYHAFKPSKHVARVKYNPELPLHITYDFNVNPYMSVGIWQITGSDLFCIDEIAGKPPKNDTKAVTRLFIERYKHHTAGVYVYGDPSGKAEDTRSEKGWNDFKIIENELPVHFHAKFRVGKKAPSVKGRGKFINEIFSYCYGGLNITIDPGAICLIEDLNYLKEAPDGTKFKEKITDKKTGIRYERYGHFSDNFDYLVCEAFKDVFREYQRSDKRKEHVGIVGRDNPSGPRSVF